MARETFGVERVVARIYDAKRAAVYERLGIPTVATVPWTTDRLLNVLTRETETTKWRDPSGNVGVAELVLHEGWVGTASPIWSQDRRAGGVHDPLRRYRIRRPLSRPATRCTSPRSPGISPRPWPSPPCRPAKTSRISGEGRHRRGRRGGPLDRPRAAENDHEVTLLERNPDHIDVDAIPAAHWRLGDACELGVLVGASRSSTW